MAMQQQPMASFAKKHGAEVSRANAEHRNKPVDTGQRNLPPGIKNGIARLSVVYTKEQDKDDGKTPRGEVFFRASAIVLGNVVSGQLVKGHDGENIEGMVTSQVVPLCAVPAKGLRKASTLSENYFEFQNLFKKLGIPAPDYDDKTDPTSQLTEAYYFAKMQELNDPERQKVAPVFISFSTRGWTPPKPQNWKIGDPTPQEMVFETWHGLADVSKLNGQLSEDPAASVTDRSGAAAPHQMSPPPTSNGPAPRQAPVASAAQATPPVAPEPTPIPLEDEVAQLVEVALGDPDGETDEGVEAHYRLEELAIEAGATEEDTKRAADWGQVAEMALGTPPAEIHARNAAAQAAAQPEADSGPAVGSKWLFAKRTKDGAKLKNNKTGQEFPAKPVEVTAVDAATKTCTVRATADGKEVADLKGKAVAVKWEWLEPIPTSTQAS